MHCPYCRETNAPTTRFCTSCGAVLVEEAPGGGPSPRPAPLGTAQERAPDHLARHAPAGRAGAVGTRSCARGRARRRMVRRRHRRPDGLGGDRVSGGRPLHHGDGIGHHDAGLDDRASAGPGSRSVAGRPAPRRSASDRRAAPPRIDRHRIPRSEPRKAAARPAASAPTVQPAAPREAVIVAEARLPEPVPQAAAAAPAAKPDRWQSLRGELAGCRSLGLLQKAVCEQGARVLALPGALGPPRPLPRGSRRHAVALRPRCEPGGTLLLLLVLLPRSRPLAASALGILGRTTLALGRRLRVAPVRRRGGGPGPLARRRGLRLGRAAALRLDRWRRRGRRGLGQGRRAPAGLLAARQAASASPGADRLARADRRSVDPRGAPAVLPAAPWAGRPRSPADAHRCRLRAVARRPVAR